MPESVRSLLTATERTFLESSFGSTVERASEKMLRSAIRRARDLRDKWLDKFTRQNRSTKRSRGAAVKGSLGTPAASSTTNIRSREKAELFDGALRRFEERLRSMLEPSAKDASRAVAATAARVSAGRSPSAAGDRRTARKPRAVGAAGSAATPPRKVKRGKASKASLARSRKATDAPTPASRSVAGSGQRLTTNPVEQRSAKAAARKARERLQGLAIHRNAHAAARVRRTQARRDGRNG